MKKITAVVLCFVMLMTVFSTALAQSDIRVTFNGEEMTFDSDPVIINGRTMVPVRKIFEELGAVVAWDANMRKADAFINGRYIAFIIDQNFAFVDDSIAKLDSPAVILNDRTLVPLRFIIENVNLENVSIDWDSNSRTAQITVAPVSDKVMYGATELPQGSASVPSFANIVEDIVPASVNAQDGATTYKYASDKITVREWSEYTMLLISCGYKAAESGDAVKTFIKDNTKISVEFPQRGTLNITVSK